MNDQMMINGIVLCIPLGFYVLYKYISNIDPLVPISICAGVGVLFIILGVFSNGGKNVSKRRAN